jgi:hypothetical protein
MSEDWKNDRAEAAIKEGTDKIMKAAQENAKLDKALEGVSNTLPDEDLPYISEESDDTQLFKVCLGVGMDQLFPEYITIDLRDDE